MPGTPVSPKLLLTRISVSKPKIYFSRCTEWLMHVSVLPAVESGNIYSLFTAFKKMHTGSSLELNILINTTNSLFKVSFRKIIVVHLFMSFSKATSGFNCINQRLKLNQIKLKALSMQVNETPQTWKRSSFSLLGLSDQRNSLRLRSRQRYKHLCCSKVSVKLFLTAMFQDPLPLKQIFPTPTSFCLPAYCSDLISFKLVQWYKCIDLLLLLLA